MSGESVRLGTRLGVSRRSAATAAASSADVYMKAWASMTWISNDEEMPPPPNSLDEMYLVHRSMQDHPLAETAFGGLAGYKLGAVGVIPGEAAISSPLFKRFVVDAADGAVSAAAINMHNLEAEIGVIMAEDVGPKSDGSLYSADECWSAVESVLPVIEMCGRRSTAECIAKQPPLGKLADALMAGGVVMGPRYARETVDRAALANYPTALLVNGKEVATGSTSECPDGGPVESLTWCVNHLLARGLILKKGHLVITGATCKSKDFKVGDEVKAVLGPAIGSVESTVAA